ncbi:hypothetical protein HY772_05760 [Candidatus Woesearchaeota archaeon]|nr:hypothetical protein [Candidatus Woesearchaeota archaeon]
MIDSIIKFIIDSSIKPISNRIASSTIARLIVDAFNATVRSTGKILACTGLDLTFVFVFGIVLGATQMKALEHLIALMKMTGEQTGGLIKIYNDTSVVAGLSVLEKSGEFKFHLQSLFFFIGVIFLSAAVLWILFEGLSWWFVYKASTKKEHQLSFWNYAKNFAIETTFFQAITIVLIISSVKLLYSQLTSITPIMTRETINLLFIILMSITWYFGALCYSMNNKSAYQNIKDAFVFGTTKFTKVLPSGLFFLVLMLNVDFVLRLLGFNTWVLVITGTILFFPVFFYSRVLAYKTVQLHWHRGAANKKQARQKIKVG